MKRSRRTTFNKIIMTEIIQSASNNFCKNFVCYFMNCKRQKVKFTITLKINTQVHKAEARIFFH